jgi:hypothetical protein
MGIFTRLCVSDLMPPLQAPSLSHQLLRRIWGSAQACDEPVFRFSVDGATFNLEA